MSRVAYVNGRYLAQRDAAVNVEDRGYQFGDGIYEVLHVNARRFVDEDRHLGRLERSLREVQIAMPMPRAALLRVLHEVVDRNRITHGLVYMQITRGVARREHWFPAKPIPPALVVTARRLPPYPTAITAWHTRVITVADDRWARCDIKSVNLLPNVLAKQAARLAGAGEAVMVDAQGIVTEGASTSVWIVDAAGALRTRHLDQGVLPGCTRDALLGLLNGAGLRAEERAFSLDELRAAREVFLTSATSFVKPVLAVDGAPVGAGTPGPVTQALFAAFGRHVAAEAA